MNARNGANRNAVALVRDALAIVLTGAALGIAFNGLEMSRRPPRGLPWVGSTPSSSNAAQSLATEEVEPAAGEFGQPPRRAGGFAGRERTTTRAVDAPSNTQSPSSARVPGSIADPARAPSPADAARRADLRAIPDPAQPIPVDLSTVARLVEANTALVVDARDPEEFRAGHIPRAVNIPYDEAIRDLGRLALLDPAGRPIIVYCSGSTCEASLKLAWMMIGDFGLRDVLVFEGGFPEWVAAGQAVTRPRP